VKNKNSWYKEREKEEETRSLGNSRFGKHQQNGLKRKKKRKTCEKRSINGTGKKKTSNRGKKKIRILDRSWDDGVRQGLKLRTEIDRKTF